MVDSEVFEQNHLQFTTLLNSLNIDMSNPVDRRRVFNMDETGVSGAKPTKALKVVHVKTLDIRPLRICSAFRGHVTALVGASADGTRLPTLFIDRSKAKKYNSSQKEVDSESSEDSDDEESIMTFLRSKMKHLNHPLCL